MAQHPAISTDKLAGAVLLGVVASGLAAAALGAAGTASASCASINGVGNTSTATNICESTPGSFAVALGPSTFATANGQFDGAIASGVTNTGGQETQAESVGTFDLAYSRGPNVGTVAGASPSDTGNIAINIANEPQLPGFIFANGVFAGGTDNVAINNGGVTNGTGFNYVQAFGTGNVATNVGGMDNHVEAGNGLFPPLTASTQSTAFNVGGIGNSVFAGPGPGNVAGLVNATGQSVVNNIH